MDKKGKKDRTHGIGCLLLLFGGAGLAEISTSSHGSFIFCSLLFGIGFALCVWSYIK